MYGWPAATMIIVTIFGSDFEGHQPGFRLVDSSFNHDEYCQKATAEIEAVRSFLEQNALARLDLKLNDVRVNCDLKFLIYDHYEMRDSVHFSADWQESYQEIFDEAVCSQQGPLNFRKAIEAGWTIASVWRFGDEARKSFKVTC